MTTHYSTRCEPSEKEIERQKEISYRKLIELIVQFRQLSQLTMHEASELLSTQQYTISRYTLRQYEQGKINMRADRFCYITSVYMLYLKENKFPIPEDINLFCTYFLP